jgi:hypothetical protein
VTWGSTALSSRKQIECSLRRVVGKFALEVSKKRTAFILRDMFQFTASQPCRRWYAPSKRREATTPTTRCNNPEFLLPRQENRFATNKILQPSVISIGYSGNLPATLAVSFPAICSLSLSRITQATRLSVVIVALLTFKWTLWRIIHTAF